MKKIVIISILSLVSMLLCAKDIVVRGHVVDAKTGEHIPFISISVKGTTISTTTDASGHYSLSENLAGKQILLVSGLGYAMQEKEVELVEGKNMELNFEVEEDMVQLNEVVVSSNRNETNKKEASIVVGVINSKLFESTNSVCLAQSLNFQPGLRMESNCQNCGFQQVRINGLEGPYSQILIDSRPIFSALSGVYGIEQIPVNMIERVEVVRGGGSALYGSNAIAGTVNIITKEPISNSFSLSHNYELIDGATADNFFNANASIVANDRKSGMYLYGSYRNREYYDSDNDGFSEIPLLKSNSIGFNSYYKINKYSKLTLEYHNLHEFRRGGNKLDYQPHETDITEQIEHYINGGGVSFNWNSPDRKNKLNIYTSGQHIDRNSYYGAGMDPNAYGHTSGLTGVAGTQFIHSFDKMFFMPADLTLGGEYQYDDLHDVQKAYNRDLVQTTKVAGFFLQNEWKNKHLSLLIGARLDKHNLLENPIISPRGNLKINLSDDLQWRLSYSSGFRAPQAFDEDLHIEAVNGNVMLIQLADNLKEEKSNSYSSSLDYYLNLGKVKTNFMVEAFYTKIDDVFKLVELGVDAQGNTLMERQNGSGAIVKGINIEGKVVPSSKYRLQFGYTFQNSEYAEAEAWSDDAALPTVKRMLRSPDQYGYFTLTLEPIKRFTLSATGSYTGSMLVPHFAGYIAQDKLQKSEEFFDAGIKASYDFMLNKGLGLQLSTGVKNLFNSYQVDFDKGENRDSGYIYGPSLPRTIFVSLKLSNLL